MGFLDKIKTFVGEHGCKVEITSLERQDPAAMSFPVHDSVLKGNFKVTASKPCTVLAHKVEVCVMKKHADGREEVVVLGEDSHDEKNQVIGLDYQWPYEMKPGDVKEDGFCVVNLDLTGALRRLGFDNPSSAVTASNLTWYVKVLADVKGTPMDADAKQTFTVVA
ncbi:MAG: hypothetical protein QM765_24025 [Myxococcales bacterium]